MRAKTLAISLVLFAVFLPLAVFFGNILVDPYGAHRYLDLKGINHYVIKNNALGRVGNGLNLYLNEYDVILLGTYRVQLAMNPRMAPLSDTRVYNASIGDTEIFEIVEQMGFILEHQPDLKEIYLGLDLHAFSANRPIHRDYEDSLFNPETSFTPYLIRTYFSKDAIFDSISTIAANLKGTLETYWIDGHYNKGATADHRTETKKLLSNYMHSKTMFGCFEYSFDKRDALLSKLEEYAARGIKINLFISPQHAKSLLVIDQVSTMELHYNWLRDMANLLETINKNQPGSAQLWNFSGFNSVTSEPIVEGHGRMEFYHEASHYNQVVGQRIVEVMQTGRPYDDFGQLISAENIEEIILSMKEGALEYKERNPSEINDLVEMFHATMNARQSNGCQPSS